MRCPFQLVTPPSKTLVDDAVRKSPFWGRGSSAKLAWRGLRCKSRKYKIVAFHTGLVASEACIVLRLVSGLAVDKAAETPPALSSIFPRVLDHDLDSCGRTRDRSRFELRRPNTLPGQLDENRPVGKWQSVGTIGVDRGSVSENGAKFKGFASSAGAINSHCRYLGGMVTPKIGDASSATAPFRCAADTVAVAIAITKGRIANNAVMTAAVSAATVLNEGNMSCSEVVDITAFRLDMILSKLSVDVSGLEGKVRPLKSHRRR